MDGALYGTVWRVTLVRFDHPFSVDLPKKHGRGGQSALHFVRLRMEKRHNYVRKVAEMAPQMCISSDRPNGTSLVLGGSADCKNELNTSDMFDKRLADIVVKVVDVSYYGENSISSPSAKKGFDFCWLGATTVRGCYAAHWWSQTEN